MAVRKKAGKPRARSTIKSACIPAELRALIEATGLTVADFAGAVGYKSRMIFLYLSDRRPVVTAVYLAAKWLAEHPPRQE